MNQRRITAGAILIAFALLTTAHAAPGELGPDEACCFPDGSCQDINTSLCIETGGAPQGPETQCLSVKCFILDEDACCFPDSSCQPLNESACLESGGIPQGPGSFCGKVICDGGFGEACCFPGGFCDLLPPSICIQQGGEPQGPKSFCIGGKKSDGKGGGKCLSITCGEPGSGDCFEIHGNPGCDDEECCSIVCLKDPFCCQVEWDELCVEGAFELCPGAPPAGACCLGQNECIFGTAATCAAAGGVYLGDGSECPQVIIVANHNGPPDQWSHSIEIVGDCPGPKGDGPACTPGPVMVDVWETSLSPGNNCENFGHPEACPIPADFFGPGSDPFADIACFAGSPIGVSDLGFGPLDFGIADTLVTRTMDPFDRCSLPSPDAVVVPIELVQLNLVSVAPISVTFNGGASSELWDVAVTITPGSDQPGGTLTATKTHCNGGTFDSTLAACPTFTFTNVNDPQQVLTLDYCATCDDAGISMTTNGQPWVHDLGDNIGLTSPVCSDFHPGILELDQSTNCDCNSNASRDKCDIEAGTSFDCDADGAPDECQVTPPCPADLNANCAGDFADILLVIAAWGPCTPECDEDLNGNGDVDFADLMVIIDNYGPCS